MELPLGIQVPIPTFEQFVFIQVALLTAVAGLVVVTSRNLFHSALALTLTFFGVAGIYVFLEAEFLAVSQVLVYVGAIAMLIAFAIMLTRGMMFGRSSPLNNQWGKSSLFALLFFMGLLAFARATPWPAAGEEVVADEAMIGALGREFVTTYVIAFEVLGLLLLLALVGAVMLARDR
jgi:NADH-quinone oxidoreductase subunit J